MEQKISNSVVMASQLKSQEVKLKLLEDENKRLLKVIFPFIFFFFK